MQCFGSVSFWCGPGSADPHPWWWIRILTLIRNRIRGNFWFCESDYYYINVNIKLLKIILKNFRHVNNTFTNHFDIIIPWFWLIFGATRIHINVSWYGSGSDQMILIRPDPDPKRCLKAIELIMYTWQL